MVTYRKMCIKSGCVVVVGIMDFSKNEGFSKSTNIGPLHVKSQ